jgi:hypothetical protein
MVHAARESTWRSWKHDSPSPRLKSRLVVVFILVVGLTSASVGATALAGRATILPDPFSPFADVFPGQPRSAVVTHGFSCAMGTYPVLPDEQCMLYPATGIFTQVGVIVSKGTVIRTDFTLREGILRLGDLALLWGIPDRQVYDNRYVMDFFWHDSGVGASALADRRQFSLFLQVWSVSFTHTKPLIIAHNF